MSLPVWPAALPYAPERSKYGVSERGSPLVRSDMQIGRTRYRRQYTLSLSRVSWGRAFEQRELWRFRHFVREVLGGGASRFVMPTWCAPQQMFQPRTVQIVDGEHGISEQDLYDLTMVSMVLVVEGM